MMKCLTGKALWRQKEKISAEEVNVKVRVSFYPEVLPSRKKKRPQVSGPKDPRQKKGTKIILYITYIFFSSIGKGHQSIEIKNDEIYFFWIFRPKQPPQKPCLNGSHSCVGKFSQFCFPSSPLPRPQSKRPIEQDISNLSVHTYDLGIFLKCRYRFCRSGAECEMLIF